MIADRFPLATARPFVPDSVAGLGGSLSGELRVRYKEKSTTDVAVDADMWLREGAAQLIPLGQDFHGITAHVTARNGLVTVDQLELRSGTGRATGSFRAGLDGLGLNVVTGSIQIDESEPFPVASEGVPLGHVTGTVDANVSVRDDGIQALLVTRGVQLQLPPSANQDVQELEAHPDVEIAQPLYAPKPEDDEEEGSSTPVTLVRTVWRSLVTSTVASTHCSSVTCVVEFTARLCTSLTTGASAYPPSPTTEPFTCAKSSSTSHSTR